MSRYFNNGTRTVSAFFGGSVFFIAWLVFSILGLHQGLVWALLLGALTTLVASILFPAYFTLRDRRYRGIEQTLPQPVLLKANVSVRNENPPRNGYLFFTAGAIYLYTRDHKPYICKELAKEQIRKIRIDKDVYMTVLAGDGEQESAMYSFVCGRCREAAEILKHNGWKIDHDA